MAEKLSLEILIKTIADAQGIKATSAEIKALSKEIGATTKEGEQLNLNQRVTAETLRKAGAAAKGAGDDAGKAGKGYNELGENFEKGASAGRVLTSVLGGNFLALGQLSGAIKTIGVLLRTNLVGTLVTLGAVAAQFILPIIQGFNKAKKSIEETTEALAKAEDAGRKFGEAKLETLNKALSAARTEAEALRAVFRENLELQGRRAEAEAAAQNARIDADPKLTADQKNERKNKVDDNLVATRRRVEDAQRNSALEESAAGVTTAADLLAKQQELNKAKLAELVEAQKAIAERAELEQELKDARRQFVLEGISAGDAPTVAQQERQADLAQTIQDKSQTLRNTPSFEELGKRSEVASGELEKFTLAVQASAEALAKEAARDKVVQASAGTKNEIINTTRAAEDARVATERQSAQLANVGTKIEDAKATQAAARAAGNRGAEGIAASLVARLEKLKAEIEAQLSDRSRLDAEIDRAITTAANGNGLNRKGSITGPDGVQRPIAPLPAANTGGVAALVPSPAAGVDNIAQAIKNAPKPEPVNLAPIATAFAEQAQATVQTIQNINQDVASIAKMVQQNTRDIASLGKGARDVREKGQQ